MDLKVLISGWYQTAINEEEIDIKKLNKVEITESLEQENIIDKQILSILTKYNIVDYQEFLEKEKNLQDQQILEIQKEIFLTCRDLFFTFDDFLKIIPSWLKEKILLSLCFL